MAKDTNTAWAGRISWSDQFIYNYYEGNWNFFWNYAGVRTQYVQNPDGGDLQQAILFILTLILALLLTT